MKKQKFKTNFNFALAFFSLFLMKCSNNDIFYQESSSKESDQIQTLSKEEIVDFYSSHFMGSSKSNLYSKSNKKQPFVLPILDSITQEQITNSNSYLTIIPTKKIKKNIDSRILLLKIDDSIQSVVLSMVSDKTKSANLFSGRIYISNLNGEFINGYVANNGYITAKLIKKTQEGNPSLMAKQAPVSDKAMDDVCPYEDKSLCGELGTVTITASGGGSDSISIIYIYSSYTYNPQNTTISDNTSTYSWNYGGGSSGNNVNLSPCDYTINGCEDEDKIINNLTGKADCAYDLLLKSGVRNPHNLITDLFIEFGDGNIGGNDLTFLMSSELPITVGGKTQLDSEGNFQILINSNLMNKLSSLEVAAIIVHEISHAFLGKHYNNSYSSFKDLYSQYINDTGLKNYSHDIMNDQFINRMATVLQNYDNQIFSNFEDYKILASQGVFDLTSSQKNALNAIKTKARNNDTKCKD